jgi:hypothetical protein
MMRLPWSIQTHNHDVLRSVNLSLDSDKLGGIGMPPCPIFG